MNHLSWQVLVTYGIFSTFLFYMTLHIRDYKGESQGFLFVLNITAICARLFQVGYAIYFIYAYSFLAAIIIIVVGILFSVSATMVEAKVSHNSSSSIPFYLSMLGFVVLPTCGFFLIRFLP